MINILRWNTVDSRDMREREKVALAWRKAEDDWYLKNWLILKIQPEGSDPSNLGALSIMRGRWDEGLVLVSQLCAFYYIGAVELISNKDLLKKKEISKKDPLVKRWKKEILKCECQLNWVLFSCWFIILYLCYIYIVLNVD